MLKEMSRSPTVQKSRTGDAAPEEMMPEQPPDENGRTSNSLTKGPGKSAGHWQPSSALMSVHICIQSVPSTSGGPGISH